MKKKFSIVVALVTMFVASAAEADVVTTPSRATQFAKNDSDIAMGCVGTLHGITASGIDHKMKVNIKVPPHRTRIAYMTATSIDPFVKGYFVGTCQ